MVYQRTLAQALAGGRIISIGRVIEKLKPEATFEIFRIFLFSNFRLVRILVPHEISHEEIYFYNLPPNHAIKSAYIQRLNEDSR